MLGNGFTQRATASFAQILLHCMYEYGISLVRQGHGPSKCEKVANQSARPLSQNVDLARELSFWLAVPRPAVALWVQMQL